jgi:hypothetical protein
MTRFKNPFDVPPPLIWKFGGLLGALLWMVVPRRWLWRLFATGVFMMATTKKRAPTNGANALAAMCELWETGWLAGDRVRALGKEYQLEDCINFRGDSAAIGDSNIIGLVLHAGRASDFSPATNPVHKEIQIYLDGTYGRGRWRHERAPWPWERFGDPTIDALVRKSEPPLDELYEVLDGKFAEMETAQQAIFAAREAARDARVNRAPESAVVSLSKALTQAVAAWEKAEEAASVAKAKVTTRQLQIQDRYRMDQYRRRGDEVPGLTDEVLGGKQ